MTGRHTDTSILGQENYTLRWDETAMKFLVRRTLFTHGSFFIPHLQPGMSVLDCASGPGSITQGIARAVAPGAVVGIDMSASQVALGTERARTAGMSNLSFREASVYELPFADASFDAVFSHALFEHLSDPVRAARECLRVLKPGGVIGVVTPDWDGFIFSPETPAMVAATREYQDTQNRNGGDVRTGRKLGAILTAAGFVEARMQARYENFEPVTIITDLLAGHFEREGQPEHAAALREWADLPDAFFAEAWVSCVARKGD